jgi:hypothetical protein
VGNKIGPQTAAAAAAQRKLIAASEPQAAAARDASRAVTATLGRRAVTAGRCAPQFCAGLWLHPARALGEAGAWSGVGPPPGERVAGRTVGQTWANELSRCPEIERWTNLCCSPSRAPGLPVGQRPDTMPTSCH